MPSRLNIFPFIKPSLVICAAALIVSACGQRGPLYLPPDKQPSQGGLKIESTIQDDTNGRSANPSANSETEKPKSSSK